MTRGKPFADGADTRRNTAGRPAGRKNMAGVLTASVTAEDVESITKRMVPLARGGDPAAAQAVALLVIAQLAAKG